MNTNLSEEQIKLLEQPLDPTRFKTRQGGGGSTLTYLAGYDIIDTANRIFGPGGWGYDIISNDAQHVLDENGQVVGTYYAARVKLSVYGCLPITEEGVCAVQQGRNPRALIDAHDMARKGAITDAMKRAFRCYGNQFGNPLYDKDFTSSDNIDHTGDKPRQQSRPASNQPVNQGQGLVLGQQRPQPSPQPGKAATQPTTPIQAAKPASNSNGNGNLEKATDQQINAILKMAGARGWDEIEIGDRLQELYGCTLSEMTKTDAGHFIQVIQQKA